MSLFSIVQGRTPPSPQVLQAAQQLLHEQAARARAAQAAAPQMNVPAPPPNAGPPMAAPPPHAGPQMAPPPPPMAAPQQMAAPQMPMSAGGAPIPGRIDGGNINTGGGTIVMGNDHTYAYGSPDAGVWRSSVDPSVPKFDPPAGFTGYGKQTAASGDNGGASTSNLYGIPTGTLDQWLLGDPVGKTFAQQYMSKTNTTNPLTGDLEQQAAQYLNANPSALAALNKALYGSTSGNPNASSAATGDAQLQRQTALDQLAADALARQEALAQKNSEDAMAAANDNANNSLTAQALQQKSQSDANTNNLDRVKDAMSDAATFMNMEAPASVLNGTYNPMDLTRKPGQTAVSNPYTHSVNPANAYGQNIPGMSVTAPPPITYSYGGPTG